MSSRRDQVDAQRYMMTRVTAALVRSEPESAESPTRRDRTGTIAGVILSILLVGVVAIWALSSSSGSTKWQGSRMLVMDASTSARYVLVDGQLRAVDDIATATLLAGGPLTPISVSSSTLAKARHGDPVGAPDGPQILPSSKQINQGVWQVCDAGGTRMALAIDVPAARDRVAADQALVVTAGGKTYLLWGGQRWQLAQPWVAQVLGLGLLAPVPVDADWLALMPSGGVAGPPTVPAAGSAGPAVAGRSTSIGQMFQVDMGNGTISHYVMTTDGLAPLTDTEYLLERARPGSAAETSISAADFAATRQRAPGNTLTTLPARLPKPLSISDGHTVCVEYSGRSGAKPQLVLAPSGTTDADKAGVSVRVAPGGGALLMPHTPTTSMDLNSEIGVLVDERGIAYPITARDAGTLGYSPARAAVLPPALLELLPLGPAIVRPDGG